MGPGWRNIPLHSSTGSVPLGVITWTVPVVAPNGNFRSDFRTTRNYFEDGRGSVKADAGRARQIGPQNLDCLYDLYFEPKYEEFRPRTIWSLSNAFTSAFKELDPVPLFKATAKLGEFLEGRFSQSF
jgi:hypothetical protein